MTGNSRSTYRLSAQRTSEAISREASSRIPGRRMYVKSRGTIRTVSYMDWLQKRQLRVEWPPRYSQLTLCRIILFMGASNWGAGPSLSCNKPSLLSLLCSRHMHTHTQADTHSGQGVDRVYTPGWGANKSFPWIHRHTHTHTHTHGAGKEVVQSPGTSFFLPRVQVSADGKLHFAIELKMEDIMASCVFLSQVFKEWFRRVEWSSLYEIYESSLYKNIHG